MKMKLSMKPVKEWLFSRRSDLTLWIIILVLLNVAAGGLFLRMDLTRDNAYSLTDASRTLLKKIDRPMSIKVFFSENLPAPYNSVERYVRDLLEEFNRSAGSNFSVSYFDMAEEESKKAADDYGIRPIQIQEIKSDQFQSRNSYMGMAIVYGDAIETLDQIDRSQGLEYKITTTLQKMLGTDNKLRSLSGKLELTLYASEELKHFNIAGLDTLEGDVQRALTELSGDMGNYISFKRVTPGQSKVTELKNQYGLQTLSWQKTSLKDGAEIPAGQGALDLVLSYNDEFRLISIPIAQKLFGGFAVNGIEDLPDRIEKKVQGLLSDNPPVAYLTGHGEAPLEDPRQGPSPITKLLSDMYELTPLSADNEGNLTIPSNVRTLIINGATERLSRNELYTIDQFLMQGGSLVLFQDALQELPHPSGDPQAPPAYQPVSNGLERLLKAHGVELEAGYILDNMCFEQRDQRYGEMQVYWAPIVQENRLNRQSPLTRNLGDLILLQASPIQLLSKKQQEIGIEAEVLFESSKESWVMKDRIALNPFGIYPPSKEEMEPQAMAVSLKGLFESAFPDKPASESEETGDIASEQHLSKGVSSGKIALVSSSYMTDGQLLNPDSPNSNAAFVLNLVDWSNGNSDIIPMRTKGMSRGALKETTPQQRNLVKGFAMAALPVLVVLAGLLVWQRQRRRRRIVEVTYSQKSLKGADSE